MIRGGRVVEADGTRAADLRIVDATIREVGPGLVSGPGATVVEAAGKLVVPGGIDPHTHLQPAFVDDLTTGSWAALAGGVTTVGTFASPRRGETTLAALERLAELVRGEAVADVTLHATGWPPSPELVAALPALAERGQPGVKVFTGWPELVLRRGAVVWDGQAIRAQSGTGALADRRPWSLADAPL